MGAGRRGGKSRRGKSSGFDAKAGAGKQMKVVGAKLKGADKGWQRRGKRDPVERLVTPRNGRRVNREFREKGFSAVTSDSEKSHQSAQ